MKVDIEEQCPHCGVLNELEWDEQSYTTICEGCGEEIILCSVCERDLNTEDCSNCPYEAELSRSEINWVYYWLVVAISFLVILLIGILTRHEVLQYRVASMIITAVLLLYVYMDYWRNKINE